MVLCEVPEMPIQPVKLDQDQLRAICAAMVLAGIVNKEGVGVLEGGWTRVLDRIAWLRGYLWAD